MSGTYVPAVADGPARRAASLRAIVLSTEAQWDNLSLATFVDRTSCKISIAYITGITGVAR